MSHAVLESLGLTAADLARMLRDEMRDTAWKRSPLGQDALSYLRAKRKRLTDASFRTYENVLAQTCEHFMDLRIEDFEPPVGTERLEEFLDARWGAMSARNYNRNLSVLRDFFKHHRLRGRLHGDPTLAIERAKARGVYRTTFTTSQVRSIIANQPELRDRVALRLLLIYGLRKGSLRAVRFDHFELVRKRLAIFAKGGKVRFVPIPDPAFWHDLELLIMQTGAAGHHFLVPRRRGNQRETVLDPTMPMGEHGMHKWWYRCLAQAGIVAIGTTSGEKMHKARHSAGQHLLDHTGNLKAVQKLLGHESIQTTGDIYTDWDDAALAASLESMLEREGF